MPDAAIGRQANLQGISLANTGGAAKIRRYEPMV
jgi:hypothetical protein